MAKQKFYAVKTGDGIVLDTWEECQKITNGTPLAFKSFTVIKDAIEYLVEAGYTNPTMLMKYYNYAAKETVLSKTTPSSAVTINSFDYVIYTDGGCDVNPGGNGGYGVVILKNNAVIKKISGGYSITTNNRMEMMAAIKALESIPEKQKVKLMSDSQYLVRTMNGEYSKKKNLDLWKILDDLVRKQSSVIFVWVKGHVGNQYNEICDTLATEGIAKQDSPIDEGYNGEVRQKDDKKEKIALKVTGTKMFGRIIAPDEIAELYNDNIPDGYMNEQCVKLIKDFKERKNDSFNAYAKLKTGGSDGFSSFKGQILTDAIDNEKILDFMKTALPLKEAEAAARWYLRGLTVQQAINKVCADMEISSNFLKR